MYKKKLLSLLLVTALGISMFVGCSGSVKQKITETTLEAGTAFEPKILEYFDISAADYVAEEWIIDTSAVDYMTPGEYEATISYKNKDYTVKVTVKDTKAPIMYMEQRYVYTNDLSKIDASVFMHSADATDCEVMLDRFTKIDDLCSINDSKLKEFLSTLKEAQDPEVLLSRENNEVTSEGIYTAILSITDTSGNVSAEEVLVIYDTSIPQVTFDDIVVEQEDLSKEPTYDLQDKSILDNVDGMVASNRITTALEKTDKENVYYVKVTATDRAGNVMETGYYITVTKPATNNDNNGGSNASDNNTNTNTNNTPSNTPSGGIVNADDFYAKYGVETINGFTIDFREVFYQSHDNVRKICAAGYYEIVDFPDGSCAMLLKSADESEWGFEQLRKHVETLGYEPHQMIGGYFYSTGAYLVEAWDYREPFDDPYKDDPSLDELFGES